MDYMQADYLRAMGVQRWRERQEYFAVLAGDDESSSESVVDQLVATKEPSNTESTTVELVSQEVNKVSVASAVNAPSADSLNEDEPPSATLKELSIPDSFPELKQQVLDGALCQSCHVNGAVFGQGDVQADWLFVNDAPTSQEVSENALLQGRAGQLFEAILLALDLQRESVYLTTFFKCSTGRGESGKLLEASCDIVLEQQIHLINPKVIVTLGEFASQSLLKRNDSLDRLRTQTNQLPYSDAVVVPLCQIQDMLDQPELKARTWHDLSRAARTISN